MPRRPAHARLAARLLGGMVLVAALGAAAAYAPGDTDAVVDAAGRSIELFVYKPSGYRGEGMIVSLHGLGRNATGYRDHTRRLAERFDALLIVPYFDRERFPTWRYQRAGIVRRDTETGAFTPQPREQWTGEVLRAVIDAVRMHEGSPEMPYVLLGHSAGAQFLARMTAFAPLPAARIVIANPSSWVAPSLTEPFPYGFGRLPAEIGNERALERFLAQPVTVVLGTADTGSVDLSQTAGAKRQGEHRYARGTRIFQSAAAIARSRGWDFGWHVVEIPNVGHSARAMYASPVVERAFCPEAAQAPEAARPPASWPCGR
jgi:pimeloyl-ACP methyl ester carboxylesterase